MKHYKVTNVSSRSARVSGAAGIIMSAGECSVFSAKDFSLSLLKQNKAFSIEEIIFENAPSKDIKSKQSKQLPKEAPQSKAKSPSAKSNADEKVKVSDNG
jgi:hypothetical protein